MNANSKIYLLKFRLFVEYAWPLFGVGSRSLLLLVLPPLLVVEVHQASTFNLIMREKVRFYGIIILKRKNLFIISNHEYIFSLDSDKLSKKSFL